MYHRVATVRADPWRLCVDPGNFESQIRALRERFDIVPLSRLREGLRPGRRSRPAASITFDDGYVDNLTVAKPILERHAVPATVFIVTGCVGRREGFWWDRLTSAVLAGGPLPGRLELASGAGPFVWQDARISLPGARGRRARSRLHDQLWHWLCDQPQPDRARALGMLEGWAGTSTASDPAGWPMTPGQVGELVASGLIEVGAHTVSHPMLTRLSSREQEVEIEQSRIECQRLLGREPRCFSFPNGDHDADSVAIVRKAGFALACTSQADLVWASGDAHATPRISVRNETGEALLRRLRWLWLA